MLYIITNNAPSLLDSPIAQWSERCTYEVTFHARVPSSILGGTNFFISLVWLPYMGIRAFFSIIPLTACRLYPHSSTPRPAHRFSFLSLASLTPPTIMASSMLLRSTLPRTFASTTGRNVLRSALQGKDILNLVSSFTYVTFHSESKFDCSICSRWTYV